MTTEKKSIRDTFNEASNEASKGPMTREETEMFYDKELPFMRKQAEFENLRLRFKEVGVEDLELQVRQIEALSYLAKWKNHQDAMKQQADQEAAEQERLANMTEEERTAELSKKMMANLADMERQIAEAESAASSTTPNSTSNPITPIAPNTTTTIKQDQGI